jgi:hypothetical protein
MAVTIRGSGQVPVQVVQATLTGPSGGVITTTSSTSFVSTGLTGTITPTNSLNKVRITYVLGNIYTPTNGLEVYVTIYRGATNISPVGTAVGAGFSSSFGNGAGVQVPHTISYIDSPATTSATTYTIYWAVNTSTASLGRNAPICTIILEELAYA